MAGRRSMGTRDMAITMAVVLLVVGLIALYGSQVSFTPGARPAPGPTPTADVIGGFEHAKATMSFPITVPRDVPAAWHPNSFSVSDPAVANDGVAQVGSLAAVRGGWVTPGQHFIGLTEAAGDADQVLRNEFGAARTLTGAVDVGGVVWHVTTGVRSEVAWVRSESSGMTTYLITGDAPEQDFRTLAMAVSG